MAHEKQQPRKPIEAEYRATGTLTLTEPPLMGRLEVPDWVTDKVVPLVGGSGVRVTFLTWIGSVDEPQLVKMCSVSRADVQATRASSAKRTALLLREQKKIAWTTAVPSKWCLFSVEMLEGGVPAGGRGDENEEKKKGTRRGRRKRTERRGGGRTYMFCFLFIFFFLTKPYIELRGPDQTAAKII
jgi:hypothetical protein